jgi:hypothetical protein
MQLAVAEGPNHSPGCLPHADAPYSTNLWREKGAWGSSAKSARRRCSSACLLPRRQSKDKLDWVRREAEITSSCLFLNVTSQECLQGEIVPTESCNPNQCRRWILRCLHVGDVISATMKSPLGILDQIIPGLLENGFCRWAKPATRNHPKSLQATQGPCALEASPSWPNPRGIRCHDQMSSIWLVAQLCLVQDQGDCLENRLMESRRRSTLYWTRSHIFFRGTISECCDLRDSSALDPRNTALSACTAPNSC